ncbi:hypothetical protein [Streptomyces sp. NPDC094032]|uniref:hypothetical protein n=1 Tax=Streptomyces sp. NPDC094032 TaxID=3155308 RepID=UPI00332066C6
MAARRCTYQTLTWQIPALSLTAQAFLMTIGLAPGTGRLARVAVGLLSIAMALLTIHSLLRHRRHELADSIWLQAFEERQGWHPVHEAAETRADKLHVSQSPLGRGRSYRMWIAGLALFGTVGAGVTLSGLLGCT